MLGFQHPTAIWTARLKRIDPLHIGGGQRAATVRALAGQPALRAEHRAKERRNKSDEEGRSHTREQSCHGGYKSGAARPCMPSINESSPPWCRSCSNRCQRIHWRGSHVL